MSRPHGATLFVILKYIPPWDDVVGKLVKIIKILGQVHKENDFGFCGKMKHQISFYGHRNQ